MMRYRRSSSFRPSVSRETPSASLTLPDSPIIDQSAVSIDLHTAIIGAGDFTLSWRHITALVHEQKKSWFSLDKTDVAETRQVLNNVSGSINSGKMLAVIGRFQSGKSLLLKILCGLKVPNITVSGQQLLNGLEIPTSLRKFFSYFPKQDSFFGSLTVEEHLMYQAVLTMDPTLSMEVKLAKIDLVLKQLDLNSCKSTIIGIPGYLDGITAEEKKKLAFATQLLKDTRILLCDEPTSNLNPSEGYHVALALQRLAIDGKRIVICSLRKPSSEIYAMFHHVLVLSNGRVVFMGQKEEAIEFCKNIGIPCPKYFNPSDQLLYIVREKIRTSGEDAVDDLCDYYMSSHFAKQFVTDSVKVSECYFIDQAREEEPYIKSTFGLWCRLFWIYLRRCSICIRRDPMLTTLQFTYGINESAFLSLMFWGHHYNQARVYAVNSMIFILLLSVTLRNIFTVIGAHCRDVTAFITEQGHSLFKTSAFIIARDLAEFYAMFAFTPMFQTMVYWSVGFVHHPVIFAGYVGIFTLEANIALSFAHFMVCLLKKPDVSKAACFMISIILGIYGGFLIHSSAMPIYSFWLKFFSWFYYGYEVLLVNQWLEISSIECEAGNETLCMETGLQVIQVMGFTYDKLQQDIWILVSMMIVFRVLSILCFLIRVYLRSWETDITDSA